MAVGPRDYIDQLLVKKYADEKVDNPSIAHMVDADKMLNAMGDFSDMRKNMKAKRQQNFSQQNKIDIQSAEIPPKTV